jgi:hypothetical protein
MYETVTTTSSPSTSATSVNHVGFDDGLRGTGGQADCDQHNYVEWNTLIEPLDSLLGLTG